MDLQLPRVVYKKLMDEPVNLEDIEEFDPQLFTTLRNISRSEQVGEMELTFSVTYDNFGMEETADLVPDGRNRRVTNEDKLEFVRLYVDWFLNKSVEQQFDPFYRGFYKVISKESIRVGLNYQLFDSDEIIKLIKGVERLDFRALQRSTRYVGIDPADQNVQWFWEIVHEFSQEQKKEFLLFATGSDRSPLRGLETLNFTITATGLDDNRIPSAHTCFNDVILPRYSSKAVMRQKLLQALEHKEGFGLI